MPLASIGALLLCSDHGAVECWPTPGPPDPLVKEVLKGTGAQVALGGGQGTSGFAGHLIHLQGSSQPAHYFFVGPWTDALGNALSANPACDMGHCLSRPKGRAGRPSNCTRLSYQCAQCFQSSPAMWKSSPMTPSKLSRPAQTSSNIWHPHIRIWKPTPQMLKKLELHRICSAPGKDW